MDDNFVFRISIIFYYILVILGGLFNALFGTLGNTIIGDTSIALFYILYFIFPIFLLFVPILLYLILKNKKSKILKYSFVSMAIYVILLICIIFGIKSYFSRYSKEKWENTIANRHYMIDDIEKKHCPIGKSRNDIVELLGVNFIQNEKNSTIMYEIEYSLVGAKYYILYFDNDIVVRTETSWID